MSAERNGPPEQLFASVRRDHLWSSAAEQIRNLIESGRLPAGTRLPGERDLCQQFGISRVSLREAIRALESAGYVEVKPGRGTFVRDPAMLHRESLASWLREHSDRVHKLFELRELIEPGLAALAARRRDPETELALRGTIEEMTFAAQRGDIPMAVAADAEFHRLLAHATANTIIDELMEQVMHVIGEERRASLQIPGQIERAIAGHEAILAAVSAGDAPGAEEAMRRHLRDAIRYIDQWLAENARSSEPEADGSGTERADAVPASNSADKPSRLKITSHARSKKGAGA